VDNVRLIAIDLDGTLLSEDGTISRENRFAIYEAQKQGCQIIISSGRSLHDIQHILQEARIDCPIISGNGAIIFHSGDIIQRKILPAAVVTTIMTLLKKNQYYFELYTNEGIAIETAGNTRLTAEMNSVQEKNHPFSLTWATRAIEIQFEQHGLQYVADFNNLDFSTLGIYKVFVFSFDQAKLTELKRKLMDRTDISITTSGWTKLEIAQPGASKGRALEEIANYFNIPLKETAAIGDNLNDLSMFQAAGTSIAMGNADEEVKKHSTYTTLSCHENGVAYALWKYCIK
jgi:Cof subfamily protein (haloacid dehalogenase superfamily)